MRLFDFSQKKNHVCCCGDGYEELQEFINKKDKLNKEEKINDLKSATKELDKKSYR